MGHVSRSGEEYVDAGMAMARKIFEKRGNHSEVHLNEGELAGFLAIAISNGVAAAKQSPASESRSPEGWRAKSKEDKDALAGACLAFAAMLKEDYGVGKQAALTCIAAAYETNEAAK